MMMKCTLYCGNALPVLKTLPTNSVHCVVTSPPYYGLRSYETAQWAGGDPDCTHAARPAPSTNETSTLSGSRATQNHAQEGQRQVCRRCGARRIDLQLGCESTPEAYVQRLVRIFCEVRRVLRNDGTCWLNLGDSYWGVKGHTRPTGGRHHTIKPKDLIGIPWMVAFALRDDGWWLRSETIWHKTNGLPESVKDRPVNSHEQVFLLTKSATYYYNYEASLEPAAYDGRRRTTKPATEKYQDGSFLAGTERAQTLHRTTVQRWPTTRDGQKMRAQRDVWSMAVGRYAGAHFATFPKELPERCLTNGCPPGGIVLDPFHGAGTTWMVAYAKRLNYIGIDLSREYLETSRARLFKKAPLLHSEVLNVPIISRPDWMTEENV